MNEENDLIKSKKSFKNVGHNRLHLNFPNGNWISTIWGVGSYTENRYIDRGKYKSFIKMYETFMVSDDVEIMIECGGKLKKKIHKKYDKDSDGSVIGHLDIIQWLEIVNLLFKEEK